MTIVERLWRLLPDRCMCFGCAREGVRGNENRIGKMLICDDCHAEMIQGKRPWPGKAYPWRQ